MAAKRTMVFTVALWMLLSGIALAAPGPFSGEVDSGGKVKYFSTERIPTQQVRVRMSNIASDGIIAVRLVNCNNLNFQGGEVTHHANNTWKNQPYSGNGICFRSSARRTNPKDTNGALPGMGVTGFTGEIQW